MAALPDFINKRSILRLNRKPNHSWSLKVDDSKLITKNITNISPTGMSFRAPLWTEFYDGQVLLFNLSFTKEDNFECEGEIVWIRKIEDNLGVMYQFGVRFQKIPAKTDAAIMRAIHNEALRERQFTVQTSTPISSRSVNKKPFLSSVFSTVFGFIFIASLTAAFLTAVFIHHINHPEESISHIFSQALINRNISSSK